MIDKIIIFTANIEKLLIQGGRKEVLLTAEHSGYSQRKFRIGDSLSAI